MKEKSFNILKLLSFILIFANVEKGNAQLAGSERNYLTGALRQTGFHVTAEGLKKWKAKQKDLYLTAIDGLPGPVKQTLISKADEALDYSWPSLSAMTYLEYRNKGIRTGFQNIQDERRKKLNNLVIGELLTHHGKYLPQVINGLWATLEESTWEIPAIIGLQKAGTDLPDPDETIIGLVSAETGLMVAAIEYMLYDELNAVSDLLIKRIDRELYKRIFNPYLLRNDFWWMGLKGQSVNNWNAWINSNILQAGFFSVTDPVELDSILDKIFLSTDHFINQYPVDGGCDEGPAYWSLAGGKLVRLLFLSKNLSAGKLSWSSVNLFRNIGDYVIKVHISADYFVNFADAGPRTVPDPVSVYRYGSLCNNDSLKHFASYLFSLENNSPPDTSLVSFLETAELYDTLVSGMIDPGLPLFSLLQDLQVCTARSVGNAEKGLFLAVQGGHNGESHNHNDVGNFIIYADGKPVIMDAGSGTYNAQTFSSKRYELWNMQSQWHNCPLVNGVMQQDGKIFKASSFSAHSGNNKVEVSMDISRAYPDSAYVKEWKRTFLFDRLSNTIRLTDKYQLQKITGTTRMDFLTCCKVREIKKGRIGFYNATGKCVLELVYPTSVMTPVIEEKMMEDEKLVSEWGDRLYRLSFRVNKKTALSNKTEFIFSASNETK